MSSAPTRSRPRASASGGGRRLAEETKRPFRPAPDDTKPVLRDPISRSCWCAASSLNWIPIGDFNKKILRNWNLKTSSGRAYKLNNFMIESSNSVRKYLTLGRNVTRAHNRNGQAKCSESLLQPMLSYCGRSERRASDTINQWEQCAFSLMSLIVIL